LISQPINQFGTLAPQYARHLQPSHKLFSSSIIITGPSNATEHGAYMMCRFIAASLVIACTAVQAQQPPQYDTDTYCKAMAGVTASGSTRDFMLKACLMQEESWANKIRRSLASFSHETIDRCDALARGATGGSYQMFAGCLAMDIADRFFEGKIDIIERKPTR
jgi:hypothetical protein